MALLWFFFGKFRQNWKNHFWGWSLVLMFGVSPLIMVPCRVKLYMWTVQFYFPKKKKKRKKKLERFSVKL